MSRWLPAALLCSLLAGVASGQEPGVAYTFDLTLDAEAGTLRGVGRIRYRNDTQKPVDELPLLLYGARFRTPDPAINDQNFDRYYVRFYDAGDMVLDSVAVGELFRLKITRDAANDDAAADVELHAIEVRETL